MVIKQWISFLLMLISVSAFAQGKKSFPVHASFQNWVGERPLALDSTYTNPHGEEFTVRNFRYYISYLSFIDTNGKVFSTPSYFLIDVRKPESLDIAMQLPFSGVKTISFIVGVDSIKNISGVQTGALDPANGMFWTWNSGYIFAKLEGTSPQSKAPQHGFTYHIGGFRTGENAQCKVELQFPKPVMIDKNPEVIIKADINTWFAGKHTIKIADIPSIMTPGPQAMQVADNYSKMFSIMVVK